MSKINKLSCAVASDKPDLIIITESWCNSSVENAQLTIPGYELQPELRQDREDTHHGIGGGLIVYVKPGMTILVHDRMVSDDNFHQFCTFDVVVKQEKWTVYAVYRPPSSTEENNERLAGLVRNCPNNSILVVILTILKLTGRTAQRPLAKVGDF